MDAFNDIIARLEIQKQAIESALAALRQVDAGVAAPEAPRTKRAYNRRVAKGVKKAAKAAKAVKKSGGISEEGRLRLAEAMKKRWAVKRAGTAVKKARKAPAKKAAAKKAPAPTA